MKKMITACFAVGMLCPCYAVHVDIPEGTTEIGYYDGYAGNTEITSITIPNSVTNIGNSAFYNCWRLTSVTIPASVTSIGESAFYGCSGLTSVTIPASVTSIGDSAFKGCQKLADSEGFVVVRGVLYDYLGDKAVVTIPASVTSIGESAFSRCSVLTSVTIPDSVTSIGELAFTRCSGLTSVTIPASVTSIGESAFSRCSSLTSVTIPASVMSIDPQVFYGCTGLKTVTIPDSVMTIGYWSFFNCGLSEVSVSAKTEINKSAFDSGVVITRRPEKVIPSVDGDEGATVTGDAVTGFVVTPSADATSVFVTIPSCVDAAKVTVVVTPETKRIMPNGAAIRVMRGEADITGFLDIPAAVGGVIVLGAATVNEEYVKEPLNAEKGAKVDFSSPGKPLLTTAPTRKGLVYRLKEGETLEAMAADTAGATKVGDGNAWTPTLSVTGGTSGFYTIEVGK